MGQTSREKVLEGIVAAMSELAASTHNTPVKNALSAMDYILSDRSSANHTPVSETTLTPHFPLGVQAGFRRLVGCLCRVDFPVPTREGIKDSPKAAPPICQGGGFWRARRRSSMFSLLEFFINRLERRSTKNLTYEFAAILRFDAHSQFCRGDRVPYYSDPRRRSPGRGTAHHPPHSWL
jgi:hypothetical protein